MMVRYAAVLYRVQAIAVALGIFFVLLGCTVSCLFIFKPLYMIGFERHGVSDATGITGDGLDEVADAFVGYFTSDDEYIVVVVAVYGEDRSLFSEKETIHMRDVKELVDNLRSLSIMSLIGLIGYVIALLFRGRSGAVLILAQRLRKSAFAIVAVAVVFALLAAVAFPALFTLFHLVSFSNDYWLLDPRQDYLVMLFTPNFFLEATGLLIGLIFVECAFLICISYALQLGVASSKQ